MDVIIITVDYYVLITKTLDSICICVILQGTVDMRYGMKCITGSF